MSESWLFAPCGGRSTWAEAFSAAFRAARDYGVRFEVKRYDVASWLYMPVMTK